MMKKEIKHISKEEIQKKETEQLLIYKELFDVWDLDLKVGDLIQHSYGISPILSIYKSNGKKKYETKDEIYITFNATHEITREDDTTYNKASVDKITVNDFCQYSSYFKIENKTVKGFEKDLTDIFTGKETIHSIIERELGHSNEVSEERGLMVQNKDVINEKKKEMIFKKNLAHALYEGMQLQLNEKKWALLRMKDEMMAVISRMNKLILQIEIFLGIEESIYQFQAGSNAHIKDPICFRQRILYMDVECGDPSDDGIDFKNIQDFVDWLLKTNTYWKKKNYEILIPETKCICVFRVRKGKKDYNVNNPFVQGMMDAANMHTYLFMRNGDNIYMIDSEKINIQGRLFPSKTEMYDLSVAAGTERSSYRKEELEDNIFSYKLNIILMQGLIERTDIFEEYKYSVNLFDPNTHDSGSIRFIYDDDESTQLPSGIETFVEWRNRLNSTITEGSRVFLISSLCTGYSKGYRPYEKKYETFVESRLFKRESKTWNEWRNIPDRPDTDLYQVYLEKNWSMYKVDRESNLGKDYLYVKYNPKDRTHAWGRKWDEDDTRKNRLSFEIKSDEDEFIINYDAIGDIDIKKLEFYMYTRIGREEYLSYIPMLMELYKHKKAELDLEGMFKKLIIQQMKWEDTKLNYVKVTKEVRWWKLKNKWKRGLNVDDVKAIRMIVQRLKRIY